jgi:hypothetical protein
MRVPPWRTSGPGVIIPRVISVFVGTHHTNQIAIEADVASVGLDGDLPAIEPTLPYIRKTTTPHSLLSDLLQIPWF